MAAALLALPTRSSSQQGGSRAAVAVADNEAMSVDQGQPLLQQQQSTEQDSQQQQDQQLPQQSTGQIEGAESASEGTFGTPSKRGSVSSGSTRGTPRTPGLRKARLALVGLGFLVIGNG